jgi:hypothetical protein
MWAEQFLYGSKKYFSTFLLNGSLGFPWRSSQSIVNLDQCFEISKIYLSHVIEMQFINNV